MSKTAFLTNTLTLPSAASGRGFKPLASLVILFVALAALPLLAHTLNEPFYITLVGRMVIFAIAVASLNLLIGFGGMVSFGHALFIGLGAYAVGGLSFYEIHNGWLQVALTVSLCAVVGLLTGAIVLRTTGIAFIMITLAFAQMFYFLLVSLKQFGGDDGLPLSQRSDFGLFSLSSDSAIYFAALALLLAVLLASHRLIHSRFGMVLRGAKANPDRMAALGFPVLRYQLAAYVLAAVVCGLSGVLLANLAQFSSPSYMAWSVSGELIVMVVLGQLLSQALWRGSLTALVVSPIVGTLTFLIVEEALKAGTERWPLILGVMIVLGVLLAGFKPSKAAP
jgi:branched-chain amino acid transport system permease protein